MRQFAPLLLASSVQAARIRSSQIYGTMAGDLHAAMDNWQEQTGEWDPYSYNDTYGYNNTHNDTDYGYNNTSRLYLDGDGMARNVEIWQIDGEMIFGGVDIDVDAAMNGGSSSGSESGSTSGSESGSDSENDGVWITVKEMWDYNEDPTAPLM